MKILGLGTNIGDKIANLQSALALLAKKDIQLIQLSSVYLTPPWGDKDQDEFLNIVAEVAYEGSPRELLQDVLQIEEEMGRVRQRKWGPRLIDIDIVEYDGLIMDEPGLQLPHPYYPKRVFVVAPFAELYPDWIPSGGERTLSDILKEMDVAEMKRLPDKLI